MNIQLGDGIGSLIQMALPFIKSVGPKVLGTFGLSSLGAITSSAINKKMNKDHNIYEIYKNFNIITNIYRIQYINSNLCGLFCVLFYLYKVNNKNKFMEFLNLFNVNDYIKNELI